MKRGINQSTVTLHQTSPSPATLTFPRFVVANTIETLLLGDLETLKLSEIPWQASSGGVLGSEGGASDAPAEKFIFDFPSAALVYYASELSIVEYGRNEVRERESGSRTVHYARRSEDDLQLARAEARNDSRRQKVLFAYCGPSRASSATYQFFTRNFRPNFNRINKGRTCVHSEPRNQYVAFFRYGRRPPPSTVQKYGWPTLRGCMLSWSSDERGKSLESSSRYFPCSSNMRLVWKSSRHLAGITYTASAIAFCHISAGRVVRVV